MKLIVPPDELRRLMARDGMSARTISRVVRRNDDWVGRYLRSRSIEPLPEPELSRIARFFGVEPQTLGGKAR